MAELANASETIEIKLNGDRRAVSPGLTVAALLAHLDVPAGRVAVELNRRIVRKTEWDAILIEPGAEVEIVQFVGGGIV